MRYRSLSWGALTSMLPKGGQDRVRWQLWKVPVFNVWSLRAGQGVRPGQPFLEKVPACRPASLPVRCSRKDDAVSIKVSPATLPQQDGHVFGIPVRGRLSGPADS